jgi:hypothetical protein
MRQGLADLLRVSVGTKRTAKMGPDIAPLILEGGLVLAAGQLPQFLNHTARHPADIGQRQP